MSQTSRSRNGNRTFRGVFLKDSKHQFLYLTTEGWKTKTLHRIEIWYVRHEGRVYLVSQYRENAHWVRNIKNRPKISFEVDGARYLGVGRIVKADDEPELAKQVSALMDAKYQWSDGLIVELRPEPGVEP